MTGCLLVSRNDGLGARFLPIVSALRLGHEIDVPVRIHWPVLNDTTHNTSQFESLFGKGFIHDHFISDAEFKTLNAGAKSIDTVLDLDKKTLRQAIVNGEIYAVSNPTRKTCLACEDPDAFAAQYARAISLISFTPEVQSHMAEIDQAFVGQRTIAYHIRHGDLTRHYKTRGKPWLAKYVPNEIYLEHMRGQSGDQDITPLLFGDCNQALGWLKKHHPKLRLIGDVVVLDGLTSLQRDFLELYAMSRTSHIFAPQMSGFSQMAAGIGQMPVSDIVADLNEAQKEAAFAALANRLQSDRQSFSNDGDAAQSLAHLVPFLAATGKARLAANLLEGEIAAGNTVPFLYHLRANLAFDRKNRAMLASYSAKSRDAMISERSVIAEIDAMTALVDLESGDVAAAIEPLRRGACLSPFGANMRDALTALCAHDTADLSAFYPIDRDLLRSPFLTKGKTNAGSAAIDTRLFGWETRYFLLGSMGRTLTVSGVARRALDALDRVERAAKSQDAALFLSAQSFRTLVEMEIDEPEKALERSLDLVRNNPDHRLSLQRHILNLRFVRDINSATQFAEKLVESYPDVACYHGILADIYVEQKNLAGALEHYAIVNPGRARYPVFAVRHANLLRRENRFDEAEALMLDCLNESGWVDPYLVDHVRAVLKYRNPAELLSRLEKLAHEGGALRKVHDLVARIKLRQGKTSEALIFARQAVLHTPANVDFQLFLVRLLHKAGQIDEARACLSSLPPSPRHAPAVALLKRALDDQSAHRLFPGAQQSI